MSQHNQEQQEGNLVATKNFSVVTYYSSIQAARHPRNVATQDTPIVTRTKLLQHNYITTLSKSIVRLFKKRHKIMSQHKNASHDKSWRTKMTTMSWPNFPLSRQSNLLGQIFGDLKFQPQSAAHHLKIYK